jgi:peptidoglycan lytic transglycosylase D
MDAQGHPSRLGSGASGIVPPVVRVQVEIDGAIVGDYRLQRPTTIGRDTSCGITIDNKYVSRQHLDLSIEGGSWSVRDLGSSNGTYLGNTRVERVPLDTPVRLRLGTDGPTIRFEVEGAASDIAATGPEISKYIDYYLAGGDAPAGSRTMFIRRAFEAVQTKQRRQYRLIIATVLLLFLAAGGYGLYLYLQTRNQRQLAEEIFYNMKSLQVDIARTEQAILKTAGPGGRQELARSRERRRQMERNYERFLTEIGFYTRNLKPDEKLIFRMARVFGESELAMPADFVTEVKSYIRKWQASDRFTKAVALAASRNYAREVATVMLAEDLPPQFFYLALQESNFDSYAVGPRTYKGIAKGAWQFIPETAMEYGLKIGPEFELPRPDPADDRHNFEKATRAAAKYIKFIYSTEAQASGLLVMASYNWGEEKVIRLIRTLPENPRERNFWQLRARYRAQIPQETYDYVLAIFSAAVIGESPRLFGFDFDSPLRHLDNPGKP